jgi:hypothetical protein
VKLANWLSTLVVALAAVILAGCGEEQTAESKCLSWLESQSQSEHVSDLSLACSLAVDWGLLNADGTMTPGALAMIIDCDTFLVCATPRLLSNVRSDPRFQQLEPITRLVLLTVLLDIERGNGFPSQRWCERSFALGQDFDFDMDYEESIACELGLDPKQIQQSLVALVSSRILHSESKVINELTGCEPDSFCYYVLDDRLVPRLTP